MIGFFFATNLCDRLYSADAAGTYFYHCHTSAALHAEMGMYGALIVNPPEGSGRVFAGGPSYDVEVIWACDEINSSLRGLSWDAGTCGGDVGLNDLNPDCFIITGVDGARSALTGCRVAVSINRGQTLLVRYINACYLPQTIRFSGLTGTIVASDGLAFSRAININSLETVAAERYDILFTSSSWGTSSVEVDVKDWITGNVLGTARTRIAVN